MSLDQQLREALESIVEPVDVDRVVAEVEARGARRAGRSWPKSAAVAAAALVLVGAGVFGAIRLGDEANETVTAGPDGTDENPTTVDAQLDGRSFTGTDVVGHDLVDGTAVTLTFEGGRLSTIAGCNTASGDYRVEDGVLRVGDVWESTLIGCSAELAAQDRWLGQFLSDGPAVELEDDRLTLASGGGVAMTLTSGSQVLRGEAAGAEPLSATLELPTTTVEAGGTIEGEFVVSNDTGAPVQVEGCGSPYWVSLNNESVFQLVPRCMALMVFTFPVGESRWPVTISASHFGCVTAGTPTAVGVGDGPVCGADGMPPGLPPGTYTATVGRDEGAPAVDDLTVEVTPAR